MQNREPTGITAPLYHFVRLNTLATGDPIHRRSGLGFAIAALPLVVVDELIGDPRYGDQNTIDGLDRSFYDVMREASVAARFMLIQAAVLGEYTSNHCVLREAWEARLTRQ